MTEVLVGENKIPTPEGRQRSTFNLSNIGKVQKTAEEVPISKPQERAPDRPIDENVLQKALEDFIEIRKAITGDLSMLKRGYVVEGSMMKINLFGNVENILFDQLKTPLITFLRERTGNSSLLIQTTIVEQPATERKPHGAKERFEQLAEKNPVLKELKERFGLDPDLA